MNAKRIVLLSCVVAFALPVSIANGQPHGAARAPVRSTMSHPGMMPGSSRMVSRVNRLEDRRLFRNRFVFIDTFGFPFFDPFFYPYPYYGYYPYGYDNNNYGDSGYGYGYGNGSSVVEL